MSVEYEVDNIDSLPATRYYNGILIPGMVNAHCHLELSFYKGVISEHTGLVDFIKQVVSKRSQFPMETKVEKAKLHNNLMWSEGIQAVGDISNDSTSFQAKQQSPIYYHTFAEYFGTPPADEAQNEFEKQTQHIALAKEMGLTISSTPHSTYLVSDALFKKGATSERLSIHFMETPAELELFQSKGGMFDFMEQCGMYVDFLGYGSHPQRLIESLPPHIPLLLVHNTNCKVEDVRKVMEYFDDVTFVLCPRSNYYIESAYPPVNVFLEAGARVALGTDSLSSNWSLSMIEEVKWLSTNNPELPLETILQWATMGGAQGLGVSNNMGSFSVGKRCGAVLLTNVDFKNMKLTQQSVAQRVDVNKL